MPVWMTWLLGVGLITAESAFLAAVGFETFCVQTGLILTILLGVRRDFAPGALTLAALLPVVEWYAGGPKGYYGLGLAVVFVGLQLSRSWLRGEWGMLHLVFGFFAALVHPLLVGGVLEFVQPSVPYGTAVLTTLPVSVVGVLIGLWPAQWLLKRADAAFEGALRKRVFK